MKKINLLLLFVGLLTYTQAQVGINTTSPQGVLHIHTGNAANAANDVVVSTVGNMGIGTANPSVKLDINTGGTAAAPVRGFKLVDGNHGERRVLSSDSQGNATWAEGAIQYQTMVDTRTGATTNLSWADPVTEMQIKTYDRVIFDRAKDIYGQHYGWNMTNQHYVVPVTGIYRISYQIYYKASSIGANLRGYIFRNNNKFVNPGILSIVDGGWDQAAYVSGLAMLDKDDVLDVRIGAFGTYSVNYFAGEGHTFFIIESL